ncbi:MAG: Hpt domain-containing protein, partial [Opitutales bacterium]
MSNNTPDESLLDLYRSEAETQCAVLSQSLVELGADLANPKKIEPAARAAHSLKGAARIVGLDLPVQLANLMEEILVAAQQGKRALDQPTLDVLLRATDWLAQSAQSPVAELAAPPAARLAEHAACLAALQSLAAQGG